MGKANNGVLNMAKEYLTINNKLIMVDGKLVEVPDNTEISDLLDAQASELDATQNNVDGLVDTINGYINGSPRGVYATLSALQSAYPTGAVGVYLTSDNGHWYYWNDTEWSDGGYYGVGDGKVKFSLNDADVNISLTLEEDIDFTYKKLISGLNITVPANINQGFLSGLNFKVGSTSIVATVTNNSDYNLYVFINGIVADVTKEANEYRVNINENKTVNSTFLCDGLNLYWYIKELEV